MKTAAVALLSVAISASAFAGPIVIVPGTADPWLAGMPDGSTASGSDVAPDESPVLVPGLTLMAGDVLTFMATGGVSHVPGCPPSCFAPDGGGFTNHAGGAENGMSGLTGPINSLLGVFLTNTQPDLNPAPATLNFQTTGINFLTLAPELQQVFFIGNGATSDGTAQQFVVPADATRLFLGTMDAFGWFNNSGTLTVEVNPGPTEVPVPEPATLLLLGAGLAARLLKHLI